MSAQWSTIRLIKKLKSTPQTLHFFNKKLENDFQNNCILEDTEPMSDKKCCLPFLLASSLSKSTPARLCCDPSRQYNEIPSKHDLEAEVGEEGKKAEVGSKC